MLFAACHVLLRRLVPWHPPCALVRFTTSFFETDFAVSVDPETNYNYLFRFEIENFIATGLQRLSLFVFSSCAVVKVRWQLRCPGFFAEP